MKVIEVQFDGHVKMPHCKRGTNVIRVGNDNKIGSSVLVDEITEDAGGIVATITVDKDEQRTTFTKRYPWTSITEVLYEPSVVPIKSDSSHSQKDAKKP